MCFSHGDHRDGDESRVHKLDKVIQRDANRMAREVKLLLLGAGESGKSTILKQMKLIYAQGFKEKERRQWKAVVFYNIIQSFQIISSAMTELDYQFDNSDNESHMAHIVVRDPISSLGRLPQDCLVPIKKLWQDHGVRKAVARGNEYGLHDNLAHFINSVDRICADGYVPSIEDILHSRLRTTGISESVFVLGQLTYRMIDVGGQRSERKKWIHCFENVTALLFVVATSGYDQCLVEDKSGNQMTEALVLWEYIVNCRWFTKSAMILFLNKIDLFQKKLSRSPISKNGFTDYRGPEDDYYVASTYILNKFRALNRNPEKEIYGHFTNATDTNLLMVTMGSVQDIIIQRNLTKFII